MHNKWSVVCGSWCKWAKHVCVLFISHGGKHLQLDQHGAMDMYTVHGPQPMVFYCQRNRMQAQKLLGSSLIESSRKHALVMDNFETTHSAMGCKMFYAVHLDLHTDYNSPILSHFIVNVAAPLWMQSVTLTIFNCSTFHWWKRHWSFLLVNWLLNMYIPYVQAVILNLLHP